MPRVILASQSPRRRQLLGQIGLQNFELLSPDADESYDSKLHPEEIVSVLSRRKAEAAAQLLGDPAAVIIAADTMVFLDQLRLGKPRNEKEAFQMLSALSGKTHQVRTGVTAAQGGRRVTKVETTDVTSGHCANGKFGLISVPATQWIRRGPMACREGPRCLWRKYRGIILM